jgi:hypothetical protein
MKAKLLIIMGCLSVLAGCASYDSAFCRSDFCTSTSYIPNAYNSNTSYNCGQTGSGFASCGYVDTSYSGGGCGTGSGCGGSSACYGGSTSYYHCKESVWDNVGGINSY